MPQTQNFSNHTRYDWSFHFTLIPACLLLIIGAAVHVYRDPAVRSAWWMLALALTFTWACFKTRIYALRNQDRIIRLEEALRMSKLCPDVAGRVGELSANQVVALRFCSDAELPAMAKRALDEKLSNQDIKQSIKAWRGDYTRI